MPRDGSGRADNAQDLGPETNHHITHGTDGKEPQTDKVARADKTAPMPEPEAGGAIPGMNASGGSSQGLAKGDNVGQGGRP